MKYIEERLGGRWFIFGDSDGHVDIANSENDTLFEKIPKETAVQMIAAHDAFVDKLYRLFNPVSAAVRIDNEAIVQVDIKDD